MKFNKYYFRILYANIRKKKNAKKIVSNCLNSYSNIRSNIKKTNVSQKSTILFSNKKKIETFLFFTGIPTYKRKVGYFSGERFLLNFLKKNFYNFENADLLIKVISIEESQFYFFHLENRFLMENLYHYFYEKKFYSPGWLFEFKKFLHYFEDEKARYCVRDPKTLKQKYFQKKTRALNSFFKKKKNSFFNKIKSWDSSYFQLTNSDLSKISRQNKKKFLIKILEFLKFLGFQKACVLSFLEKSKYDSARISIYKFVLSSYLIFVGKNFNYLDKTCFHFIEKYQRNQILKIKNKENIYWHESHVDITRKSQIENDKNRFFLFSKRKKEFLSEILFILLFNFTSVFRSHPNQNFFQVYNTFFMTNQNFFGSWLLYLPFEFIKKISNSKKYEKIQKFRIDNLKSKIYESLQNIKFKRGLFFLKEVFLLI
jgi:hypothetical protein